MHAGAKESVGVHVAVGAVIDSSRCLVTTTPILFEVSQSVCLSVIPKHARLAPLLSPYDESNVQMMIEYVLCECFHLEMAFATTEHFSFKQRISPPD